MSSRSARCAREIGAPAHDGVADATRSDDWVLVLPEPQNGPSLRAQRANLLGATSVSFGGVAATSFTVDSRSRIAVVVPGGAKTGVINVVTPLGTTKSANKFTVQ